MLDDQIGQNVFERRVGVVIALELEEDVQQRAPFPFGDPDREEEENREVSGFLHFNAVMMEVRRDERGRDAALLQSAAIGHSRSDHRHLDWIQHAEVVFYVSESVPVLAGMENPRVWLVREEGR